MQFKIEQIAIAPKNPALARLFLNALSTGDWVEDTVKATGSVFGVEGENEANLQFNYEFGDGKLEFEILDYTEGYNWVVEGERFGSVCHLGMHVSAEELKQWRAFFKDAGIGVAQDVKTYSHTNPVIAGKREYNYVIFNTREEIGVDLKFIVRRNLTDEEIVTPND